jgi:hypothetical protein
MICNMLLFYWNTIFITMFCAKSPKPSPKSLALSADQVVPNITLQVEAIRPDGSHAPMIRLNTRADWDRRYWFARPIALPRGTRVQVTANLQDPDLMSAAFSSSTAPPAATSPLRVMLSVVSTQSKPAAP